MHHGLETNRRSQIQDAGPIPGLIRPTVSGPPPVTLHLRLLATSDLHAHILPWDYHADRASDARGLSRIAGLIAAARAEAANVLLLDNGDFLHGSPLGDFVVQKAGFAGDHPMIAAMNRLGYDAATLGNHEFSHGIAVLRQSLAQTRFPVVSANLWNIAEDASFVPPFTILDRRMVDSAGTHHDLRIGIIGFLPPQTVIWERAQLQGHLTTSDIVTSAKTLIPRLQAQGADLIIALSHSGIGTGQTGQGDENASAALAKVAGIDAVIAGHTHEVFPEPSGTMALHGKPAVMPGFFGSHLGVIDMALRPTRAGWRVASHRGEARAISGRDARSGRTVALIAGLPEIEALAAPFHAALKAEGDRVIGHSAQPLHSYLALIRDCAALRLVAEAQGDHMRDRLSDGAFAGLPVLSAVAPFKAGGRGGPDNYTDIPAGPVIARHIADLYQHPNRLVALRLTGAELALWLERSVSLFHQIAPGAQEAELVDPAFPSFNFDMIYGLTYAIDLTQPPGFDARGRQIGRGGRRITDLRRDGRAVDPQEVFALVTNSYRSSGGAGFPGCTAAQTIDTSSLAANDILSRHIARLGHIPAATPSEPTWRFVPQEGTSVILQSAPAAALHLKDVSAMRPAPLELLPSGFQRFRLHL